MYIQHFGLAQYPFSLTPNTRYFLKLPSHQKAFDLLVTALDGVLHFAKITGEVGTGKTMLCRKLLNALAFHPEKYLTAYIPHPVLSEEGIMHAIADELGIDRDDNISYRALLKTVTAALVENAQAGKSVALFIDEAQAMPEETLKAVHLLTQVDLADDNHLQVVLFGQPELEELLERPGLKSLQRDLAFSYELSALDLKGLKSYIAHRLDKAGYNGPPLFTEKALDALYQASGGIPRLINILCHKSLMSAFGKGMLLVDEAHVELAISDTEGVGDSSSMIASLFSH